MAAPTRFAPPVIKTTLPSKRRPSGPAGQVDSFNLAQSAVACEPRKGTVVEDFDPPAPVPDDDAKAHSARVVAYVRDEIARAGGFIPLAR